MVGGLQSACRAAEEALIDSDEDARASEAVRRAKRELKGLQRQLGGTQIQPLEGGG